MAGGQGVGQPVVTQVPIAVPREPLTLSLSVQWHVCISQQFLLLPCGEVGCERAGAGVVPPRVMSGVLMPAGTREQNQRGSLGSGVGAQAGAESGVSGREPGDSHCVHFHTVVLSRAGPDGTKSCDSPSNMARCTVSAVTRPSVTCCPVWQKAAVLQFLTHLLVPVRHGVPPPPHSGSAGGCALCLCPVTIRVIRGPGMQEASSTLTLLVLRKPLRMSQPIWVHCPLPARQI